MKENDELYYLQHGEKRPGCLASAGQAVLGLLRLIFRPKNLKVNDLQALQNLYDRTGKPTEFDGDKYKKRGGQ